MYNFEWYTHLCKYYNVTPDEALKLGTRSKGRKPNLPSSITCKAVSDKTFEDIWEEKQRKSIQEIFDFYKDQGAWSAFRQCVRHKDLESLHMSYFQLLSKNMILREGSHICEYGCGVAPFTTTLLKTLQDKDVNLEITLCDVDCEHFNFAKFRINSILKESGFKNIKVNFLEVKKDSLPKFENKIDIIFCFEVLEHVPSPVSVIENFSKNTKPGSVYIENFIKHDDLTDDDDGPDLVSARKERNRYYEIIEDNFNLIHPTKKDISDNPSCTKIWQRNSL